MSIEAQMDSNVARVEDIEPAKQVPTPESKADPKPEIHQTTTVVKKKKSGVGKCLGCFGIFVLVGLLVLGTAGYLGYRAIKNFNETEDFGVSISRESFDNLMQEAGVEINVDDISELCFDCAPLTYTGQKDAKLAISQEEVTSWFGLINDSSYNLEKFQLRFSEDLVEVSTSIGYQGSQYPIYASGGVSRVSDKQLDFDLQNVKVGPISIPAEYITMGETWLEDMASRKLNEIEGLNIHALKVTDGELLFEGTVPESVTK